VRGDRRRLDLIALQLCGRRYPDLHAEGRMEVDAWCCERLLHEPDPRVQCARIVQAGPVSARYPVEGEVGELWACGVPVDKDKPVQAFLALRSICATRVADFDLARALPVGIAIPAWATTGQRPWNESSHRLLVPLYDAAGQLRSVIARSIDPACSLKSTSPSGCARSQLVMACALARQLLATATRPQWWPQHAELRVVVAEGEVDFLVAGTQWSAAAECAPATFGIVSGSWSAEVAARIADGSTVVVLPIRTRRASGMRLSSPRASRAEPYGLSVGRRAHERGQAAPMLCVALECSANVLGAQVGLSFSPIASTTAGATALPIGPREVATLHADDIVVNVS
jgi:hypothetical protein